MKTKAHIVAMSSLDVLGNTPGRSAIMFRGSPAPEAIDGKFEIDNTDDFMFSRPALVPQSLWKNFERINQIGAATISNLFADYMWKQYTTVDHSKEFPKESAIVFSAQTDGLANFERLHNGTRIPPKQLLSNGRDFLVGFISKMYGLNGPSTGLAAACATGLYNLEYGMRLIDEHDFVIVGATDAGTSHLSMEYFRTLGAIGTHSAPFDKDRDGFVMGEGAAAVIICNSETVEKYGLNTIAIVHDVQLTNDGDSGSLTNPGDGGYRAMKNLPYDTDTLAFIKAHGTSTPMGDPHEVDQINELFPELPIVSYKSMIGHTIGASGLIEMLHSISHLKSGVIPANRNINTLYQENPNIITESIETDKRFFINNAFGFGGKCASALVEVV